MDQFNGNIADYKARIADYTNIVKGINKECEPNTETGFLGCTAAELELRLGDYETKLTNLAMDLEMQETMKMSIQQEWDDINAEKAAYEA